MKGRNITKSDKERFDKLTQSGCCVCRKFLGIFSPAAIHHLDGKTKLGAHQLTIPLCGQHHQTGGYGVALHAGKKAFEKNFCTEQELLTFQNELIEEYKDGCE